MAHMAALIAQRSAKLVELEKLDAEIRVTAAKLAGVPEAHPETANGTSNKVVETGSNGANSHPVFPVLLSEGERPRLAPRKMQILRILQEKPEASLATMAIRVYGNEGRASRVNVSTYTTDLKAEGYIEPGSRPGTFRLTEKGVLAIQ